MSACDEGGLSGPALRQSIHGTCAVSEALESRVDAALALTDSEDLLDLGSGSGDFAGRLVEAGHRGRVVGIDTSEPLVDQALARFPGAAFQVADAASLPFEDGSFDCVTARHVLFHLAEIPKALAEARRVLRPGGRFLAVTNASGNLEEFWEAAGEALAGEAGFAPLFTVGGSSEEDLAGLVRASFGNARLFQVEGFLAFPDPNVPVSYLDSYRSHYQVDDLAWAAGMEKARDAFATRTAKGPWRVTRRAALISAGRG